MKLIPRISPAIRAVACSAAVILVPALSAQVTDGPPAAKLVAEPATVTIRVGDSTQIKVRAFDASGKEIPDAQVRVFGSRRNVGYDDGWVKAYAAGSFKLTAAASGANGMPVILEIPVTSTWPALARLEIVPSSGPLYVGVTQSNSVKGYLANGTERTDVKPTWRSSNTAIATVDRFGNVRAKAPGTVTITATVEGKSADRSETVLANPVRTIDLAFRDTTIRTGDVIHLKATGKAADGKVVANAPMVWSYTYAPDDSLASLASTGRCPCSCRRETTSALLAASICPSSSSPRALRAL